VKPNVIELFPDGRIGGWVMPDEPAMSSDKGWSDAIIQYNKAIESAKRDVVYFKDQHKIKVFMNYAVNSFEVGKPYPIPDGYEVRIKKVDTYGNECFTESPCGCECYAILVPKQESDKKQIMAEKFWSNIEKSYPVVSKNEYVLDEETLINASTLPKLTKGIITKWKAEMQKLHDSRDGWCHAYSELKEVHESLKENQLTKQQSIEEAAESYANEQSNVSKMQYEINAHRNGYIAGAKWMQEQFKH